MKIKLLKNTKIGQYSYSVGAELEVDRPTGMALVRKKIAMSEEFVTLTEKVAEKVSKIKVEEISENLPTNAKKLVKTIKMLVNIPTLELLLNDARISVRDAASTRLEELH